MLRPHRRRGRRQLPRPGLPGRRARGPHRRGARRLAVSSIRSRRRSSVRRGPVRDLHAGHADGRPSVPRFARSRAAPRQPAGDAPRPTPRSARRSPGNLCRCTGYGRIVDAIRLAATRARARHGRSVRGRGRGRGAGPARLLDLDDPGADSPRNLAEAFALLAEGGRRPLAGGTDALVEHAAGVGDVARYLDLSALAELRGIRVEDGMLVLGAATTYAELRRSPLVAEHVPVLAAMAAEVGAAQIQNRGTLGGNLAHGLPGRRQPPGAPGPRRGDRGRAASVASGPSQPRPSSRGTAGRPSRPAS